MSTYRVVFSGQPLPGFDRDTAIANFARLLKRSPEQAAGAFAGKPLTLKKGVGKEEAEKVCAALERSGLSVRVEAELSMALELSPEMEAAGAPPPKPVVNTPPPPSVPAIKSTVALELVRDEGEHVEEASKPPMTCPACGQVQPKHVICEKCGIVIAKFLQRQATAKAAVAAQPAGGGNPYAPGVAAPEAPAEASGEFALPPLFAFSLEGRIGRVRYMGWSLAPMIPALIALLLFFMGPGGIAVAIALLVATLVLAIRYIVLRLHDREQSGWLALLIVVPLINLGLILYLIFAPGTQGDNAYGPPPPANSAGVIVAASFYVLGTIGSFFITPPAQ